MCIRSRDFWLGPFLLCPRSRTRLDNARGYLVDGDIGHDPDPKRTADLRAQVRGCQIRRAQWTAQFVRSMYKKPQSEAYLKKITDAAMSVPTNSAILLALNAYASGRDWRPVLSKVDNPVLYVISTTSKDQAEALKEKVPSARNQHQQP